MPSLAHMAFHHAPTNWAPWSEWTVVGTPNCHQPESNNRWAAFSAVRPNFNVGQAVIHAVSLSTHSRMASYSPHAIPQWAMKTHQCTLRSWLWVALGSVILGHVLTSVGAHMTGTPCSPFSLGPMYLLWPDQVGMHISMVHPAPSCVSPYGLWPHGMLS